MVHENVFFLLLHVTFQRSFSTQACSDRFSRLSRHSLNGARGLAALVHQRRLKLTRAGTKHEQERMLVRSTASVRGRGHPCATGSKPVRFVTAETGIVAKPSLVISLVVGSE